MVKKFKNFAKKVYESKDSIDFLTFYSGMLLISLGITVLGMLLARIFPPFSTIILAISALILILTIVAQPIIAFIGYLITRYERKQTEKPSASAKRSPTNKTFTRDRDYFPETFDSRKH